MPVDDVRARYLRDRVMTATPAQRVVMLYDRLGLDLTLAQNCPDAASAGAHLSHAQHVVAELRSSLDVTAGGPAENLAALYAYLLTELIEVRGGDTDRLPGVCSIVSTLRDAFATAADQVAAEANAQSSPTAWVG